MFHKYNVSLVFAVLIHLYPKGPYGVVWHLLWTDHSWLVSRDRSRDGNFPMTSACTKKYAITLKKTYHRENWINRESNSVCDWLHNANSFILSLTDIFQYSIYWPFKVVIASSCSLKRKWLSDPFLLKNGDNSVQRWDYNLISPPLRPHIPANLWIKACPGPLNMVSLDRLFYHKNKMPPKGVWTAHSGKNGKETLMSGWNDVSGVAARRSCHWYTAVVAVSPLYVKQWSSRMGGPSGAEIGRVCRGVWAPFVSGERGLCSLNQGGGTNRLSL